MNRSVVLRNEAIPCPAAKPRYSYVASNATTPIKLANNHPGALNTASSTSGMSTTAVSTRFILQIVLLDSRLHSKSAGRFAEKQCSRQLMRLLGRRQSTVATLAPLIFRDRLQQVLPTHI